MNRPVLAPGDTGANVETLQRYLTWLGYPTAVTGRYDAATVDAVRTFQRDHELALTGVADQDLWNRLEYGTESSESIPRIVSAGWVSFEDRTLTYMARNIGTGAARATRDELRLDLDRRDAPSEPVLVTEFAVGEVPAESTYVGHFQLDLLPKGDYHAVIRLDAERRALTPDVTSAEQCIAFTLRVIGDAPTFIAWR